MLAELASELVLLLKLISMEKPTRRRSRLEALTVNRYVKASAIAGVAAAPISVLANFSGDYSVTPPGPANYALPRGTTNTFGDWDASLSAGIFYTASLNTTGAPNQISLSLNENGDALFPTYQFLTMAAATGLVSFNYTVSNPNTFGTASFVDQTTSTSIPLIGSGTFAAAVAAGDVFGFQLAFSSYGSTLGLAINSFSAPEPVVSTPDTGSTLGLLAFGFVGLLALRANRQRVS